MGSTHVVVFVFLLIRYISGTPTSSPQWRRTVNFWHPKIFQFSLLSSPNQPPSPCPHSSLSPSPSFLCFLQKWFLGVSLLGHSVITSSISDRKTLVAGVGHGDDLGFFFPMSPPGFPKMVTTAAQKKTRANLLELLESFSQCGTPTLIGAETWQRVGAGGQEEHLEIGETVKMATHAKSFADQLHFWEQVWILNMTKTD